MRSARASGSARHHEFNVWKRPLDVLDVMADLVPDEEGDPRLAFRAEPRHQAVRRIGADEHGAVAAAVGGSLAGIKSIAVVRGEAGDEAQVDHPDIGGALLHEALPGRDGVIPGACDDGA